MIIRGIIEETKETEATLIQKIDRILTAIMSGESEEDKLESACQIGIISCKRLGRFNKNRIRVVSVEFKHKEDTDFNLKNRFDLVKGIYVTMNILLRQKRKGKHCYLS